jgi:DNA-binding CsgD family transcriptional regulator
VLYRLAFDHVAAGEPREALGPALEIVDCAVESVINRGATVASMAMALLGRPDEAIAFAAEADEAYCRCNDGPSVGHLLGAVLGHAAAGRLLEADRSARLGYDLSLARGDKEGMEKFCLLRGWVLVDAGLLLDAAKLFREGAALAKETGHLPDRRWCLGGLALAEGMAGKAEAAAATLVVLDQLPKHWMDGFDADLIERGRAWAHAAAGEMSSARSTLRAAAAGRSHSGEMPVSEARLHHDLARLGEPVPAAESLARLAASTPTEWVCALAQHAEALATPTGATLEAAARRLEDLGALGLAGEAGLSAVAAYGDEGLLRAATALSRDVSSWIKRCGDVVAPGVLGNPTFAQLTAREREVATLAASGASSKAIADRLYLSVRTVDNHLRSVYNKLGISGREELARALAGE